MANNFTSYVSKNVGTSAATLVTVGAGTQTTLIGLSCANTTASPVTVDAYITRSATDYYLIKGATVPVGGTLVIVGGDMKTVLIPSDALKIVSSAATSIDVVASVLNIT
jgi:hypothetical protein